ncbi:MAG: type II secretion system protein [Shewanella sp.]
MKTHQQNGFTLIELVVVVIILGILAVTAASKFLNLKTDARIAVLHGMEAAAMDAAKLVYAKSAIAGIETNTVDWINNELPATTDDNSVVIDGTRVLVDEGYPIPIWTGNFEHVMNIDATVVETDGDIVDEWGVHQISNGFSLSPPNILYSDRCYVVVSEYESDFMVYIEDVDC